MKDIDPEKYAHLVRAAVLRYYPPQRSCVETVRVAVATARYFGLRIDPLPVRVMFATREWLSWTEGGYVGPQRGWSIGVTGSGCIDEHTWDGHLCGYADGVLIDFSADQYHRPEKGIVVGGPLAFAVSRERLRDGVEGDLPGGVVCSYQEIGDYQWKRFPAWTENKGVARRATAEAIRAVRAAYGG